jgi:hypothetical protein
VLVIWMDRTGTDFHSVDMRVVRKLSEHCEDLHAHLGRHLDVGAGAALEYGRCWGGRWANGGS